MGCEERMKSPHICRIDIRSFRLRMILQKPSHEILIVPEAFFCETGQ